MRIAFCLHGPNGINGPNAWLLRILPLLRERGLEPEALYLANKIEVPCRIRETLQVKGFRVRTAALRRTTESTVQEIWAALRDDPPDVFIPNYSVAAHFAARFLREAGVTTVGVLHSDDPFYHDLLDYFVRGDERWRLSAIVAVSTYLHNMVAGSPEASAIPSARIPCGVAIETVSVNRRRDVFRLAYIGRLAERQKRIRRVAERLAGVVQNVPGIEAVIFGDGPDRAIVESVASRPECRSRLILGGPVWFDEVNNVLCGCDVFVLLSDFEGLSVSLLEAMASGVVPIIAKMRSGCTEVVIDGENGFVVDGDDQAAFDAVVRRLVQDPSLWERLSRAARRTVINRGFDANTCADRWTEFLRQLRPASVGRPNRLADLQAADRWSLPPRSIRLGGIRESDRRSPDTRINEIIATNRPLYLWGASVAGAGFLIERPNIRKVVVGIIDSDPAKHERELSCCRICAPSVLLNHRGEKPFVVITSQFATEIGANLARMGFSEESDFVSA